MPAADDHIDLVAARPPASDEAYRPFIAASFALAILFGFALGLHVALSRLMGGVSPERTADYIQAHGQVQLLGFAGLYVMGMSLRLLPRFSGAKVAFPQLLPAVLGLLIGSLVLRALVLPLTSGDLHDEVLLAVTLGVLGGSACFFMVIAGTARRRTRPLDLSAWAFVAGAAFHLVASIAAVAMTADTVADGARALPYLGNQSLLQLQLSGFLLCFILGVSLRAIPTMVGVDRPSPVSGFVLLGSLCAGAAVLGISLLYLTYVDYLDAVAATGGAAFAVLGAVMIGLSWQTGAIRSLSNRLRPASQPHLWLVRSAFGWLIVAGVIAAYHGMASLIDSSLPGQFAFDAVRHALGLGVVTMLIAGMSLMIVPEFAAQRRHADQRTLAFVLFIVLNLATVLRVAPAMAETAWSADLRNASMAVGGLLAEVAVIVFALSLLRLFRGGVSTRR